MRRNKQWRLLVLAVILVIAPFKVYADSSSSTHYRVDQTFFGSGGELNACSTGSTGYCSKQTLGEISIGNTSSTNYGAYAGFNTTDEPYIEFVVSGGTVDLGYLSPSSTSLASSTFYVRAWQAAGYVVRTESDPPKNGTYTMNALTSQSAATAGTEQFGINLKANTQPSNIGADPTQLPDATFSFGYAASGYDTANVYKYNKGDIIARSDKSSSITLYTVSYIFNISEITPAGQFTFVHNLVATGTY